MKLNSSVSQLLAVRKNRAPKGALRPSRYNDTLDGVTRVRKHGALKGALRPAQDAYVEREYTDGQKAPSAKRCIKTRIRCAHAAQNATSESTERQKVH